jgi:hypothetical protein
MLLSTRCMTRSSMAPRSVRSRKLSTFAKVGWVTKNLSRALPCFGRHVKLVPVVFAVVSTHPRRFDVRQAAGRKNNCRIFMTRWWKTCCTNSTKWNKSRKNIHSYHSRFIPEGVARHLRYSSQTPTFYQNWAMSNTGDVTDGKPIAVWSQSISCKCY